MTRSDRIRQRTDTRHDQTDKTATQSMRYPTTNMTTDTQRSEDRSETTVVSQSASITSDRVRCWPSMQVGATPRTTCYEVKIDVR